MTITGPASRSTASTSAPDHPATTATTTATAAAAAAVANAATAHAHTTHAHIVHTGGGDQQRSRAADSAGPVSDFVSGSGAASGAASVSSSGSGPGADVLRMVDMGSGDGRICIEAARRGIYAEGIEMNPWLVLWSKYWAWSEGLSDLTRFYDVGDYWVLASHTHHPPLTTRHSPPTTHHSPGFMWAIIGCWTCRSLT